MKIIAFETLFEVSVNGLMKSMKKSVSNTSDALKSFLARKFFRRQASLMWRRCPILQRLFPPPSSGIVVKLDVYVGSKLKSM
jgi:hypothetical protein